MRWSSSKQQSWLRTRGGTRVHPVTYQPQTERPATGTRKGTQEESGSSSSLYSETRTEDSKAFPGKKAPPTLSSHAQPLNFHFKAFFRAITQTSKAENWHSINVYDCCWMTHINWIKLFEKKGYKRLWKTVQPCINWMTYSLGRRMGWEVEEFLEYSMTAELLGILFSS